MTNNELLVDQLFYLYLLKSSNIVNDYEVRNKIEDYNYKTLNKFLLNLLFRNIHLKLIVYLNCIVIGLPGVQYLSGQSAILRSCVKRNGKCVD